MSEQRKQILLGKLIDKAPQIVFLYHLYDPEKPCLEDKLAQKIDTKHLGSIDTLFVFGFANCIYLELGSWLACSDKRLVFVIHNPATIESLLLTPYAEEMIDSPKIHFYVMAEDTMDQIDALLLQFPSTKIETLFTKGFFHLSEKKRRALRWQVMRRSLFINALITEKLHYPLLAGNLLNNMQALKNASDAAALAGSMEGVVAILCGAGPSLDDDIENIKACKGKALIIACGSALAALTAAGIEPDIFVAIDPNKEEYDRIKVAAPLSIPFFFSGRLNAPCLTLGVWPLVYIPTKTCGPLEYALHEALEEFPSIVGIDLTEDALSVTTLAAALSIFLGCKALIFSGVDLCYPKGCRYSKYLGHVASEQALCADRLLQKRNREGDRILTRVRWVMEAHALAALAKAHRKVSFACTTKKAMPISFVHYKPFDEMIPELVPAFDLAGRIHSLLQQYPIQEVGAIDSFTEEIYASIGRCKTLAEAMALRLEENENKGLYTQMPMSCPAVTVMKMDIEEEKAYNYILAPMADGYSLLHKEALQRPMMLWQKVAKLSSGLLYAAREFRRV